MISLATTTYTEGIDLSVYNPIPTPEGVQEAYQAGRRFMIARCSIGTTLDPHYTKLVELFGNEGFTVDIAYHFALPYSDPILSARSAVKIVKAMGLESPTIALDCETMGEVKADPARNIAYRPPVSKEHALAWYKAFITTALDELRPTKGPGVLIYTGAGFWNPLMQPVVDQQWASLPLWVANWTSGPAPMNTHPWDQNWMFWQYKAEDPSGQWVGTCPGMTGIVDCNRFKGTHDDLKRFLGQAVSVIPETLPDPSKAAAGAAVGVALAGAAVACATKAAKLW